MQNITTSSDSSTFTASGRFVAAAVSVAAALTCSGVYAQGKSGAGATEAYAAGRILVMPRAGLPDAALARFLKENGGGKARRIGNNDLRIVELPAGREKAMVERLARHPHFKFAELDRRIPIDLAANDPFLGSQWHIPKIRADLAWESATGAGITIAILDSGVDTQHPDLAGSLVAGYNFVDGNTNVEDVKNHGTKAAGSAAAVLNNGIGVASIAGKLTIMPIRVSDSTGYATWSAIASGLTYAADRGARVANISFNGAAGSSSVMSAANYMKSKGGLVFVSAGNSNLDPGYANTSAVVIVAATNSSDAKSSFSNFGDHVHLSAPGEGIYTTDWRQSYASVSGTSFAAPIAAGVAALVMSANPGLSSAQVENILFTTAVDLGAAGRDVYFGYGRVDAAAAVAAAVKTVSTADTVAPTVSITAPLASATVSGLVPVNVSATDNVGVSKVELRVNGNLVATDTASPHAFSWDSTKAVNGMTSLVARACDTATNCADSAAVSVNVANSVAVDTTPPTVAITNPANGTKVSGPKLTISVSASDNSSSAALKHSLLIDGKVVATATGASLSHNWNVRQAAPGSHIIEARVSDAAGNLTATSVSVSK